MAVRLVALALFIALAGCSEDPPAEDPEPTTTQGPVVDGADVGGARVIRQPREIFNETFSFPTSTEGEPFEAAFEVDADAQRLELRMQAFGDCPVIQGSGSPQVVFTAPGGTATAIEEFGGSSGGSFTSLCSPDDGLGQRDLGASSKTAAAEAGSWSLASQGEFTGDVRITVTADPM